MIVFVEKTVARVRCHKEGHGFSYERSELENQVQSSQDFSTKKIPLTKPLPYSKDKMLFITSVQKPSIFVIL